MRTINLIASAALLALVSCAPKAPEYQLVWSDEFDGTEINTDYWNLEDNARGGGNAELQYFAPKNASIERHPVSGESCLVLSAWTAKPPAISLTPVSPSVFTKKFSRPLTA